MSIVFTVGQLKAVALASAKRDIRHYLNGVLWEQDDEGAHLIATDGQRVHIVRVPRVEGANENGRMFLCNGEVANWLEIDGPATANNRVINIMGNPSYNLEEAAKEYPVLMSVFQGGIGADAKSYSPASLLDVQKALQILAPKRRGLRVLPIRTPGSNVFSNSRVPGFRAALLPIADSEKPWIP